MKISQEAITGAHQIRDYGDGFLLIQLADGQMQRLTGSFILSSEQLQSPAPHFNNTDDLTVFAALETFEYDVLIVVIHPQMNNDTALLMQQFRRAGLAAEFMSLGPACRTFNLLVAEGRKPLICASL